MNRMAIILILLSGSPVLAAPPTTQTLVDSCAICHGTDGREVKGGLDGLAGEEAREIGEEMDEMRVDPHEGRLMSIIARGFTDEQVRAMAEYYATVRPLKGKGKKGN